MNKTVATLCLACAPFMALADHADVWLILENNQVVLSPTDLESGSTVKIDATTGRYLFTGDFSDLGQGPRGTDDPGYQANGGTFQPGAILNYRAVGSLNYWNGIEWVNTVPGLESMSYTDALGTETTWTTTGVTQAAGAVDEILGNGGIHSHLDFEIDNNGSTPAPGIYLVDLELFVTASLGGAVVHTSSDPFRIAFNYQMSEAAFNTAVAALTNPEDEDIPFVPIWALLAMAGGLLLSGGKLKKTARC